MTHSASIIALASVLLCASGCAVDTDGEVAEAVDFESEAVTRTVDRNRVLADNEIEGRADVTVTQVQRFLERKGSALARYSDGGRTAADLIVSTVVRCSAGCWTGALGTHDGCR